MADVNVNFELEPDVTFLADLTVETTTPTVHGELSGRDYPNQHPISAITGLEQELSDLGSETQKGKTAYETIQTYGNIVTHNVNEFATASQGELSQTALQPNDNISELTNNAGYITNSALNGYATETYVDTGLATKQATLVSGTNIKTINNESLLGSGNINIESGAVDSVNGQTGDVVLTASDVGALPSSTTIPTKTSDLTNDSGYITNSALTGYATETFVTSQGYITSSAITNMQTTTNLVTSVSSSSTDSQYISAKLFYDTCGDIETLINAL
jgi:hypothetical protein